MRILNQYIAVETLRNEERLKMSNEMIINLWKNGLTVLQITKEYMTKHNKNLKTGEKKINRKQAQEHVEPIIFDYQVNLLKRG